MILADEPSGNLDSKNALELHNLFFKLRQDLNQDFCDCYAQCRVVADGGSSVGDP